MNAGQVIRATILRYSDEARDLVLVCDRAWLDQRGLYLAAAACLSPTPVSIPMGCTVSHAYTPFDIDALASSSFSLVPERGGASFDAGVNVVELPLDACIAPECWLAALGLVLSRCHAIASPAVASLQEWSDPADPGSPPMAGYRLVNLPLDAGASIADTVEHARLQLRHAPWLADALMSELKARCDQPVEIGVGVLFPASLPFDVACVTSHEYLPCHSAIFPLTLVVGSQDDPRVACYFDSAVYTASSVEWMLHSVVHTATQFARGTGSVAGIELLSAQAQQCVAALGRGLDLAPAAPLRVEQAFRRVAAEHPDAIALSYGDEAVTYAQLDDLSSRLATALMGRGVVHDSFVGICLRRSVPLVVAMLAILKCGAVYVPMDPDYPDDRLRFTAEDAELKLVITEAGAFPGEPGMEVVAVGDLIGQAMAMSVDLPAISGLDSHAAYVIYTSGSTGRPKGVLIPHGNVMSLIRATRERFAFSPADTWTLFHSGAFDFSVWEIWACLLTGGHLVVVSHEVSRDPDQFRDLINRKSVSVLNQTPSAFYQLIEADQRERVSDSLRLVIFGGETLNTRSLLHWFDRHPESRCRLVNMFGITETTVHVT
ncbi:MAG: AMP-binding protein, partial [Burkholderiales bacterium]